MSKIDLGRKWSDELEPVTVSELKDETHYPDLHIGDVEDKRLAEMPDEGEMTVRYKIKSRTHNERERKGKKCHSCSVTLEIRSIDPPAGKTKKKDSDFGARKAISEYFKDK
jgi:hypothetical protein